MKLLRHGSGLADRNAQDYGIQGKFCWDTLLGTLYQLSPKVLLGYRNIDL